MKLTVESAKSNFQVSNLQPDDVIIADVANYIGTAVTTVIMVVGFFSKMSHKNHSVHSHDTSKAYNTMLNKIQKHLDQGIEKWGDIVNNSDPKASNTTLRP